jgi:hypothetical protein
VYLKRLERGRFQLPAVDDKRVKVEMEGRAARDATRRHRSQRQAPRPLDAAARGDRQRPLSWDLTWSMVVPPVDHDCVLKGVVVELADKLAKVEHELAQLKKAHIGPKSERTKMPRVPHREPTPEERLAKRRANAADRAQTQTVRTEHKVPLEQRQCPACGSWTLKPIGDGRTTVVYDFVPARFIRHEHVQEVLKCKCGDYVVTAQCYVDNDCRISLGAWLVLK